MKLVSFVRVSRMYPFGDVGSLLVSAQCVWHEKRFCEFVACHGHLVCSLTHDDLKGAP